ncbi:anaphase-promoting complex, cyclosome, subunit 4-domain-containing protein [Flammula alnicola]|nr:anaphase-promoting complex, cyclosome, subunit 4-domain-containing protein [Flammula alnicola]
MATNAFTSLANIRLHLPGRLVPNSCCPDKDLVLLFSRLGGTDRMSLWSSNQGSKIWETDVGDGDDNRHVVGIAWSPDVLTTSKTGSAHSILKLLPLLDNLQEETEKLTATDLFAFQGSHTRTSHKTQLPPVIDTWPTLSADHIMASINPSSHSKPSSDSANLDEVDNSNLNSILLVTDNVGRLFSYLDGTFPLGFIPFGFAFDFSSTVKHPLRPLFVGQPRIVHDGISRTNLNPVIIDVPLLAQRRSRDLAKLSSTARELVWYVLRVVKEMREVWYGSESNTGARELGPKWVHMLDSKQKEQFGQEGTNPILDLTYLLTTGKASDSLSDFLGSGEQMSERSIQKWESTVSEALVKLRDSAEKQIAPALQRLHLVLDEIQGWSKLPQFALFELPPEDIVICLDLASRGIVIANWLAATSRTELSRFREFISWLRFEVNNVNSANDGNIPRHDILEVNNYFITGLASSSIDKWFIGPIPQFQDVDLGLPDYGNSSLDAALEQAFKIARDSRQVAWQTTAPRTDISHLDRNIEALIQDLAHRSERVFHHAAGAASRSAVVSFDAALKAERVPEKGLSPEEPLAFPFRERTSLKENGELLQHLVAHIPSKGNNTMLLTQLRFGVEAAELPSEIGITLLECYLPEEDEEQSNFDLLDADFFDDECVVIVYRLVQGETTLNYNDTGYQKLLHDGYVKGSTREDLMQDTLKLWKNGDLSATRIPVNRRRALSGCKNGGSTSIPSPSNSNSHSKPASESTSRMSDVALRKKKNADAQAAFRARRANYIATLEETVTSLESVVIQLQESCRESRNESMELRQENARLRHENREREKLFRALYHQTRKRGPAPEADDLPPPPLSSPFLGHAQPNGLSSHPTASLLQQSYGNGLAYRGEDSTACHGTYNTSGASSSNFSNQSPTVPFPNNEISTDGSSGSALNHRVGKYPPYSYPMHGASRDPRWQGQPSLPPDVHSGESITPPHSESPTYVESPSLTSTDMSTYPGRFSGDEQKAALNSVLDSAPYVFPNGDRFHQNMGESMPNSRSMSPTTSTPSSSTSISLTSSFPFTFHEPSAGQDRADFDYRRHSLPHCPEVTLHGGTADISLTSQTADAARYRMGRRPDSGADHQPILPPSENGSHHDQANSDGDPSFNDPHVRSRRNTIPANSRSPSPGSTSISCTVAVIKAQAFGALRRTRARTKKTSEGAARVAMDVLEARGIGMGGSTGSKRPRLEEEDIDAETP